MPDVVDEVPARLRALEDDLRRLAERVERIERRALVAPAAALGSGEAAHASLTASPEDRAAATPTSATGLLNLGGRTLLALAGAYLLRAATDERLVSHAVGVALGLAYALLWLFLADRAAASGERASACAHGSASALIAYPLIGEGGARLGLLTPPAALASLLVVCGAGAALARRRSLGLVAAAHLGLALATAWWLLMASHELLAAAATLLTLALFAEMLARADRWAGLRWPAALALDAAILLTAWLAGRASGLPRGYPPLPTRGALAVSLALPLLYLTSTAVRTLVGGRDVTLFEALQCPAALALGLLGSTRIVGAPGAPPHVALAVAGLGLAALCYGVAFAFVERRRGRGINFYFYSSLAALLSLWAVRGARAPELRLTVLYAFAFSAAWLGQRYGRMTLRWHGMLYLCVAALDGGLLSHSTAGLLSRGASVHVPPGAGDWLGAALAIACGIVLARAPVEAGDSWRRLPQTIVAALAAWSLGGIVVAELAGASVRLAQPAPLAALRTAVIASLAVVAAALWRRVARPELRWIVYPLLALGGFKLLVEDLPAGHPVALAASFLLYGIALISAPRLLRSS